jgi:hypothetical protein
MHTEDLEAQVGSDGRGSVATPRSPLVEVAATTPPIALAFSGGGIRAGSVASGILCYVEGAGLADRVDVVACVSGGGYAGSSYAAWKRSQTAGNQTGSGPESGARVTSMNG